MRQLSVIALLFTSLAFVTSSFADNAGPSTSSERPAERLRLDVQRAIRNGHPTDEELATLERALGALQQARTARAGRQPADRARLAVALQNAARVFQSDSFLPADREAIQHDIQEIQKRHDN